MVLLEQVSLVKRFAFQSQMRSLTEQASEMGQIVGRAAMDAAKPRS